MEPVEKILRLLEERLEQAEAEMLGGRVTTIEKYQALAQQRQLLITLIADIKEIVADDNEPTPEAGGAAG